MISLERCDPTSLSCHFVGYSVVLVVVLVVGSVVCSVFFGLSVAIALQLLLQGSMMQ
jgi:hypothetical protein